MFWASAVSAVCLSSGRLDPFTQSVIEITDWVIVYHLPLDRHTAWLREAMVFPTPLFTSAHTCRALCRKWTNTCSALWDDMSFAIFLWRRILTNETCFSKFYDCQRVSTAKTSYLIIHNIYLRRSEPSQCLQLSQNRRGSTSKLCVKSYASSEQRNPCSAYLCGGSTTR